jgi:hypothetical protein
VNLGDLINQLADNAQTRALPDASEIRRNGDRLRRRTRRRGLIYAAAAAVVVAAATLAITQNLTRSAPEPAGRLGGWQVTRTIDVPGSGVIVYADNSVWVVDNKNLEVTADGTPAGELYQIDPESGEVLDRVPGAVGGWPTVGAGAIWESDVALEMLTRVDLSSHQVTRIAIHHPKQHPQGSAVAAGNLWVINNTAGELVKMDPRTYRVLQTIHVGEYTHGEAPRSIITDGNDLWVSNDNGLVQRFDGATGEQLSRLQLPYREVLFDGINTRRHVAYAHGLRGNSLLEIDLDQKGTWNGRELSLSGNVDSLLLGFAAAPNSLWAVTSNPDQLLRVDPDRFKITGRIPLPGMNHESNVPVAMTAGGGAVWIRIQDKVLELKQGQ